MRNVFCESLLAEAGRADFIFLTGDLGYNALEPLQAALGRRFLNAGVAEQNLVSVAAGLAREGLRPWAYSIAPFIYARPFEQVRNDVCMHRLPVVLVGNGGGYGYGVMGATHHALEDYGVLLTLPHLRVFLPAFDDDVRAQVPLLFGTDAPAYLRLGVSELPADLGSSPYAPWRRFLAGGGKTMVVAGPLAGSVLAAARHIPAPARPTVWVVAELPILDLPTELLEDIRRTNALHVVEEHVHQGGVGRMMAHLLLESGIAPREFRIHGARGYVSGLSGSQKFHRTECGLDAPSLMASIVGARP